jgi:hypothetical protein
MESLDVGGEAWDDAAAGVVRHLTQPRSVFWDGSEGLTDVGLQDLTELQGLTHLHMLFNPYLSAELMDDGVHAENGGSGALRLVQADKVGAYYQHRHGSSRRGNAACDCDTMHYAGPNPFGLCSS